MTYKAMPAKKTPEQTRHLAELWLTGRVYTSDTVEGNVLASVFMPIGFGALAGYSKDQCGRLMVVAVLDEDHHIPGRYLNGYPMFTACQLWRRADAKRAQELADRMKAAMDGVR